MLPIVNWTPLITAANTAKDGTGVVAAVFTVPKNLMPWGAILRKIVFRAVGTNTATVARVFVNNGQSSASPLNNVLAAEITLDATTLSEVAALADEELVLNWLLPPGYVVYVTIGTTVAAGWRAAAFGELLDQKDRPYAERFAGGAT